MSLVIACGITPIERRAASGSLCTSYPLMKAFPAVIGISVVIMRIRVLLPAPFGPSRPKICPSLTLKETPSTAVKSPYFLVMFSTTMASSRSRPSPALHAWTRKSSPRLPAFATLNLCRVSQRRRARLPHSYIPFPVSACSARVATESVYRANHGVTSLLWGSSTSAVMPGTYRMPGLSISSLICTVLMSRLRRLTSRWVAKSPSAALAITLP